MSSKERFEARIDYHYRFTFRIEKNTILILSVGMHDKGLGGNKIDKNYII